MSSKTIIVLILLIIILGLLISGYTAKSHLPRVDLSRVQEIKIPTKNVTLHAKIVGNLNVGDVLIAVNGGPGQSSRYMASLEQLVSAKTNCSVTLQILRLCVRLWVLKRFIFWAIPGEG
jgi:hypothetical protein